MTRLAPGSIFADRYEIIGAVGDGGMGEVYRAVDVALCREVAIKVLGATVTRDTEIRFEREAHAIARLDHPGCVRIVDYGRAGDRQYIALELLAGPSLASLLDREGPFSIMRAVYLADRLLVAIEHAHGLGVCHRDLKPENIVLVGGVRPVIVDFGLASLGDDAALTQQGMCVGSPSYLAPERLLGRPYDARVDLYAIGVILYEMIAGLRPFVGSSSREVMQHALERPPRPLRAVRADVPAALEAVIVRLLAKDPERRFADANAARAALASAVEEAPTDRPELTLRGATLTLALAENPVWTRFWCWLRYGRWRWRLHRA